MVLFVFEDFVEVFVVVKVGEVVVYCEFVEFLVDLFECFLFVLQVLF